MKMLIVMKIQKIIIIFSLKAQSIFSYQWRWLCTALSTRNDLSKTIAYNNNSTDDIVGGGDDDDVMIVTMMMMMMMMMM